MTRRASASAVAVAVAALAFPAGAAARPADVVVTNTPSNPVPAAIVGTPTVRVDASANTVRVDSSSAAPVVTTPAARPIQIYVAATSSAFTNIVPVSAPSDRPLLLRKVIVARPGGNIQQDLHFVVRIKSGAGTVPYSIEMPVPLVDGRGSLDLGGIYLDPNQERARLGDAVEMRVHQLGDGTTPRTFELIVIADQL